MRSPIVLLMIVCAVLYASAAAGGGPHEVQVYPDRINLNSPEAADQILAVGSDENGMTVDLSRDVRYRLSVEGIAFISDTGRIVPLNDGRCDLIVDSGQQQQVIPVEVRGMKAPEPVSFRNEVIPVLTRAGCNSGGCHGKAEGQNGFRLTVFGYDADSDHEAIVRDGRGRRVFPAVPEHSLLLAKATATVPHGGGRKMEPASRWHRLLTRWISEGLSLDPESDHPVVAIQVQPQEVVLSAFGKQQLRVEAVDRLGRRRGVTVEAEFQSNNDVVAGIDTDGLIQADQVPGEAAILVRYMGHVAVCRVICPGPERPFVRPSENNFIDRLVWDKLERLRVTPSEPASDAVFLRRVYLDTIGTLPTVEEARCFLTDDSVEKRSRLIRQLLDRPEYADYWAQRWTDLLQVDRDIVTPQGAVAMTRWVRGQLQQNVGYDQFVRSILTAQGATVAESPAAFFQVQSDPELAARAVSQLFLGVRIECAQCHHHPFEVWDRNDYYAWAGLFTGIERKSLPAGAMKIVSKPGEDLNHPGTGAAVPAAVFGEPPMVFSSTDDRRQVLATWMTGPENSFFTQTIVNRLTAHYLGRGLVEPVDDLRATNPASNEPLLRALTEHLVELQFDLKAFTETLLNSRVYQLSAETNDSNRRDEQNYSRALWKALPAEVLLDAISQVTGIPESFNGWPVGYRAIQIWDNKLPSHFLQIFGRPPRQTVCACERGTEPDIAQALHLMNSETTTRRLEDRNGRAAVLATSELSDHQIIEELYLAAYSRFPAEAELRLMLSYFAAANDRRQSVEDALWTLLNSREFVLNH